MYVRFVTKEEKREGKTIISIIIITTIIIIMWAGDLVTDNRL